MTTSDGPSKKRRRTNEQTTHILEMTVEKGIAEEVATLRFDKNNKEIVFFTRCPWCDVTRTKPKSYCLPIHRDAIGTRIYETDPQERNKARLFRHVKESHKVIVEHIERTAQSPVKKNTREETLAGGQSEDEATSEDEPELIQEGEDDYDLVNEVYAAELSNHLDHELHLPEDIEWNTGNLSNSVTFKSFLSAIYNLELNHALTLSCVQDIINLIRIAFICPDELSIHMPSSVHLLHKAFDTENIAAKKRVVCRCCEVLPEALTDENNLSNREKQEASCPTCLASIYKEERGVYKPALPYFMFGVEQQIKSLFKKPSFRRLRTKGRDDEEGIYRSESIRELMSAEHSPDKEHPVEPNVMKEDRSIWSIGMDGVQPFKKKNHSCVKIVMRCEDVPFSDRCKSEYCRTLAIIPGPSEPSDFNPYLCDIGREFEKLRKNGVKIMYNDEETGEVKEETHFPIWRFIMADARGREKIINEKGANSYFPCIWCTQKATKVTYGKDSNRRDTIHMMGLKDAAEYKSLSGEVTKIVRERHTDVPRPTRDEIRSIHNKIRDEQEKSWRGELHSKLEDVTAKAEYAWKGSPQVFKVVPTLDIIDSCPLPIYHLLLLNITKKFICYLYDGLGKTKTQASQGNKNRRMRIQISDKKLDQVESTVISHCEVKKPYTSLRLCYTWISEELGTFVKEFSPFIFDSENTGMKVLTDEAEEAWKHLRKLTMYYLGYGSNKEEAIDSLFAFARMCEEESPQLMTSQLHTAVCRLPIQEERLGRAYQLGELWVERAIRDVKATKSVARVEETLARRQLFKEALERQWTDLDPKMLSLEYCPRKMIRNLNLCDQGCKGSNDCHYELKGQGREVCIPGHLVNAAEGKGKTGPSLRAMAACLLQAVNDYRSQTKLQSLNKEFAILEHNSLSIIRKDWTEEVKSAKSREKQRKSNIVEVTVNGERKIATILKFFKIARVERDNRAVTRILEWETFPPSHTRFALVHIYKGELQENGYVHHQYYRDDEAFEQKNYILPITDIVGKVMAASYPHTLIRQLGQGQRGDPSEPNTVLVFKPQQLYYQTSPSGS